MLNMKYLVNHTIKTLLIILPRTANSGPRYLWACGPVLPEVPGGWRRSMS